MSSSASRYSLGEGGAWIRPAPLRAGDLVAIVAPSSPFSHIVVWKGLAFLRERYRLRFNHGLFTRTHYLAGGDARRRDELSRALEDPDVKAIIAARGGYGAGRFVHEVSWEVLRDKPRWIVGFSDITALHVEAQRVGVMSLHASHVTALGWCDRDARAGMIQALENPFSPRRFDGLETWVDGEAEGTLFGGNLAILHACAAAGRLHVPDGSIIFIEDVTERPYRLDRMLAGLLVGGHFRRARGFIVGELTDCSPGPDGATASGVLRELLAPLGIPVVAGFPAGHGRRNEPLVLGGTARIRAEATGVVELG